MVRTQGQYNRNDYLQGFRLHYRGGFSNWLIYFMCGAFSFYVLLNFAFSKFPYPHFNLSRSTSKKSLPDGAINCTIRSDFRTVTRSLESSFMPT